MKLIRKDTKVAIVATKEILVGKCWILEDSFSAGPEGSFDFNYGFRGTEIDWDSQDTASYFNNALDKGLIFIDENGEEVLEKDCELVTQLNWKE